MSDAAFPGLYRGICVDPRDAQRKGRIKVIVPQVTGDAAVLTAWPCHRVVDTFLDIPATPPKKGTLPSPNLPVANQGVWVMYEGGCSDKPIWVGVF